MDKLHFEYGGRAFLGIAQTVQKSCPLGPTMIEIDVELKDDQTAYAGDIYQAYRLTLDPELLTFILGGVTFVVGAAVKKYVELWVEARFKQSRERVNPSPQLLHEELCLWLSLTMHDAALYAEKTKKQGIKTRGARLYINVPVDQRKRSFSRIWLTYVLGSEGISVDTDRDVFYNRWFLPFPNVVVPFIEQQATKDTNVQAWLGRPLSDIPDWQAVAGTNSIGISCNGKVKFVGPSAPSDTFLEYLTTHPPFLFDPTTSLLHWRSCKACEGKTMIPIAMRESAPGVDACSVCLPPRINSPL